MSKWEHTHRQPVIEQLEARTLMSATPMDLSVAVLSSTVPLSVVSGQPAQGVVTVGLTNLAATKASGSVTIAIYAVHGNAAINSSTALLVSATKSLSIQPDLAKLFTLNVKAIPANVAAGTYALVARTTDALHDLATSPAGPSISVDAPFLRFSETEMSQKLPSDGVAGDQTPASIVVSLTNTGNIPSTKPTLVDIYASTNGVIDDNSIFISGVSKGGKIKSGATEAVTVKLGSFPNVPNATYDLIAQTIDQNKNTSTSPASISVVLAPPFIALADQLLTPVIKFGKPDEQGSETITGSFVLKLTNNGTGPSDENLIVSLYLSTSDSAAGIFTKAIKTVTPNLTVNPQQTKTLSFKSSLTPTENDTPVFFIISVTDSDGNLTYGANGTPFDLFV